MKLSPISRTAKQVITSTSFGTYQVLRPPRSHNPTFVPPTFVPPHIRRPPYVPLNFFSRKGIDEELVEREEDDLEGYHGEDGVGNLETGRIPLGGEEERTIRYMGRMVAEVLEGASKLVKVSHERVFKPSTLGMETPEMDLNDIETYLSGRYDHLSTRQTHTLPHHSETCISIAVGI